MVTADTCAGVEMQGADSTAHLEREKNTVLTAGTTSRRGTRLSCVPSMLGSWEVKVFYPT